MFCKCEQFFPHTVRLFFPLEYFTLTYDLSGFKSRVKRRLSPFGIFLKRVCYVLSTFGIFFFLTTCLLVVVQPCVEWIPIKKVTCRANPLWRESTHFRLSQFYFLNIHNPCEFFEKDYYWFTNVLEQIF